jgi:hypothetical protein
MNLIRTFLFVTISLAASVSLANERNMPVEPQLAPDAYQAAGIGHLQDQTIPDNTSEIRIWMTSGPVLAEYMLRIRSNADGKFSGEVWLELRSVIFTDTREIERRKYWLRHCRDLKADKDHVICRKDFVRTPKWKLIYKELTALGIESLPDQSAFPPPKLEINDGIWIEVEVRHGTSYRKYEYLDPELRDEPEARSASRIADIMRNEVIRNLR